MRRSRACIGFLAPLARLAGSHHAGTHLHICQLWVEGLAKGMWAQPSRPSDSGSKSTGTQTRPFVYYCLRLLLHYSKHRVAHKLKIFITWPLTETVTDLGLSPCLMVIFFSSIFLNREMNLPLGTEHTTRVLELIEYLGHLGKICL